jgi:hypothetical protein
LNKPHRFSEFEIGTFITINLFSISYKRNIFTLKIGFYFRTYLS